MRFLFRVTRHSAFVRISSNTSQGFPYSVYRNATDWNSVKSADQKKEFNFFANFVPSFPENER
jgi:hypothetical protein